MSALVSATLDNVSAARGLHTLTESVDFTALSFLGLIGTFHFYTPYAYSFRISAAVCLFQARTTIRLCRDDNYSNLLYIKNRLLSTFFILFSDSVFYLPSATVREPDLTFGFLSSRAI